MRRLSGRVDDGLRLNFGYKLQNALAIPDVEIVMRVVADICSKAIQRPAGIAFGPEEYSSFVVVDTKNAEPITGQMKAYFGPNQPAGAGNERFSFQRDSLAYKGWV